MLVLARRVGEALQIKLDDGRLVRVVVRRVRGHRMSVGIEAPTGVRVRRVESSATQSLKPEAQP